MGLFKRKEDAPDGEAPPEHAHDDTEASPEHAHDGTVARPPISDAMEEGRNEPGPDPAEGPEGPIAVESPEEPSDLADAATPTSSEDEVPAIDAESSSVDDPVSDHEPDEVAQEEEHDEFAATRERVADPDDWRMERRDQSLEINSGHQRVKLSPEELKDAQRFRAFTHAATATSAVFVLAALVLHTASIGPRGLETWMITLAIGIFLVATWTFPRARFEPVQPSGTPEELSQARHVRELTLRSFGVGFGILFLIIGFLEMMALFVALGFIADLSQSQVTLAKHFVYIPALALTALIAGVYIRMRMPTFAVPPPHQKKIELAGYILFGCASAVALFFALGIDPVVRFTEVEPRQAIYITTLGILTALAFGTIRLGFPDAVRIILAEIEQSKQVDRKSAETMHKKMLRNYVLALIFVVGSIGFLVSKAAGLIDTETSGGLDVVLLVYLGFGILFLGTVLMHFFQARQISRRVILPHKGKTGPGKRRYRPEEVTRFLIIGISGFFALIFIIITLLAATGGMTAIGPFEVTPAHATDFAVFAIMVAIGPYGFYYAREAVRIRTIDDKFPDFLRDLAESQRAGMTLPSALVTASKGVYGPLTKEIKIMAAQVEWGVSFGDALRRFAERTRTPLIERTVSLVIEASASGGNVVDILAAASDDAREIKNIITERKQQMGVYSMIIYIAFGVFLTVIGVLNSQFIPELAGATSQVSGTSLGGIQFGDIDIPTYQRLFWHAALIQGIGGGLVAGVMTEGHPLSGLRHSFIMTAISYVMFRFIIM